MKYISYTLIVVIVLLSYKAIGQQVTINYIGNDAKQFQTLSKLDKNFSNPNTAIFSLKESIRKIQQAGYLEANIDSLYTDSLTWIVKPYIGNKYTWLNITPDSMPSQLLNHMGFDSRMYVNTPIDTKQLQLLMNKAIQYLENNGYPFAQAYLKNITIQEQSVKASWHIDKGMFVKIDSIDLNEDAGVTLNYIQQFLGIHVGDVYQESAIKNISKRIRESNIITEQYPWRFKFSIHKNVLTLRVKSKAANKADVLIGLLPNNAENQGKLLLTGDVKLAAVNALSRGESFLFTWQNLQYKSPRINMQLQYPYLLKWPIIVSGVFDLYKKDTTFRTVHAELAFMYELDANKTIKAFYNSTNNRLITVNKNNIISARSLPANGDVKSSTAGLEATYYHVDYKINPRKGFAFTCRSGITLRSIIKNETIENTFDSQRGETFAYLYDSVKLKNRSYFVKGNFSYYIPIKKRIVVSTHYNGAYLFNTEKIFRNELFQIGGYRLLRGIDEGSLFAKNYTLFTLEPRFIMSSNSYVFLFLDQAWVHMPYYSNPNERYTNLGSGIQFETKSGLFNLSVALSSTSQTSFLIKQTKLHFGYISYF